MEPQDERKLAFYQVLEMVTFIWEWYKISCQKWNEISEEKVNFKKKLVSDIEIDGTIYSHITDYLRYIEATSFSIGVGMIGLSANNAIALACRTKNIASIDSKLERYKKGERYKFGKVPINKCLNDIFGARIIIDYPLSLSDIENFLKDNFPQWENLKITDSSKNEYKATHIYFRKDNFFLPWELQIWFADDEASNRNSHQKYKQGYTMWEHSLREEEKL